MRAPALKVLLSLIVEPDLVGETTRTIAAHAGNISPQTANDVRRRLLEQGAVLRSKTGWRWTELGRREALETFVSAYSTTLFPALLIGRFRARETSLPALEAAVSDALAAKATWRLGGGAACQRLTKYYRGDQTLVYIDELPPNTARELRLVSDRGGPVIFARLPGSSALISPDKATVHPLLVYADLLRENHDRAREAAKDIYERYVRELVTI